MKRRECEDFEDDGTERSIPWTLILAHEGRLTRMLRGRLQDPLDVEDCVQEAMLRAAAYEKLDPERVGQFLTTVALRLCVDHYRHKDRARRIPAWANAGAPPAQTEEVVVDQAFGRWFLRQVRCLRGREREVMEARISGLSTVDFAEKHQISVKSAESAFTRARSRLFHVYARAMDN